MTADVVERKTAAWVNHSSRFCVRQLDYKSQYAQVYFARLMELSPSLRHQAEIKWPGIAIQKLLCLEDGVDQIAVGTLFKDMKLKPTVLKEYTQDKSLSQQLSTNYFCDGSDSLILEDESARIQVQGALSPGECVTGSIIAVRGVYDATAGIFTITDHTYAGMAPQPSLPVLPERKLLAVTSGLCIGDPSADMPRMMLLLNWLKGLTGVGMDTCKDVVRLVVCGGVLGNVDQLATAPAASKQQRFAMEAVSEVDRFLAEVASAMPVDIMPGAGDPANHALPQQPLHRCLLPAAAPYDSCKRVPNPHAFTLDGVSCLCTSGQNIHDIQRYSEEADTLQVMEQNLVQRHLCPTAPDTLASYPFTDQDPFIVQSTPHIYCAGNQRKFGSKIVEEKTGQKVCLVSVPSFALTGDIVLVDLASLVCTPVSFGIDL